MARNDLLETLRPLTTSCQWLCVFPVQANSSGVQLSSRLYRISIIVLILVLSLHCYEVPYWLHVFLIENISQSTHRDKPADLNNFFVILLYFTAGIAVFNIVVFLINQVIDILLEQT
jgi:hypothetical protein